MPTGPEIRRQFVDYFAAAGHAVVPSASLVPADPTLMFTNAGMVQFKDVFTQREKRDYTRAVSVQKCLRVSGKHNDLEEVGRTPRHHTFFEMLGNFSFGDYFKEEAMRLAWGLLVGEWRIPIDRLWFTVHDSDDQSYDLWTRRFGVPAARVQRLGDKDNFWSMGDVGPCGPCSEIHYDFGPEMGPDESGPVGGSGRYVEIWNLVFMQYERFGDGTMQPLPRPSVDTGMGLERVTSLLQGVRSNYDTDLLRGVMEVAARLAGLDAGSAGGERGVALRVLADHARACAFMVSDGIIPSNDGRGYVLRRIARRAIRFGVKLGLGSEPFFHACTDAVVERFGGAFPDLLERRDFVREVIRSEEERFGETRDKGLALLEDALSRLAPGEKVPGEVVFRLHDTFGFPSDLTALIAEERGVVVDLEGFEACMEAQKAAGRLAWKGSGSEGTERVWHALAALGKVEFTGYETADAESVVVGLARGGEPVERLLPGETGGVVVARTPFYAESGGQVGDQGRIVAGSAAFVVDDTTAPVPGLVVHHGRQHGGALSLGDRVALRVDDGRRADVRRNHTATHLLHAALRKTLGSHVLQKGSLVAPDRLRFDFSHHKALDPSEIRRVEDLVIEEVLRNEAVGVDTSTLDAARARGAMSLFGERYGEQVRVVEVPGFSLELCGGTHVGRTGDIGGFRIVSEGGVAAGVRRIEAVTGLGAVAASRRDAEALMSLAVILRASGADLETAARRVIDENKALRRQIEESQRKAALSEADQLLSRAEAVAGFKVLAAESADPKGMREQADKLRSQLGSGVVVLGSRADGKVSLLVAVTPDLAGKRVHAGNLVRVLAERVGGRGGGRPDFAQAGGPDVGALEGALAAAVGEVERQVAGV